MDIARRLRVHGWVQGVGFRAFVVREATMRGVNGWVRNRVDGTVEALLWGDPAGVEGLIARIREGPRWGRVDRLDVAVEPEDGDRQRGCHVLPDR